MDTSNLAHPKGRPSALVRADRRKAITAKDEKESAKVKVRSEGRCEVTEVSGLWYAGTVKMFKYHYSCQRLASEVHHMLGGRGVRARGDSANAIRKQHCCQGCHARITNHTLRRVGGMVPHFTDAYERVR